MKQEPIGFEGSYFMFFYHQLFLRFTFIFADIEISFNVFFIPLPRDQIFFPFSLLILHSHTSPAQKTRGFPWEMDRSFAAIIVLQASSFSVQLLFLSAPSKNGKLSHPSPFSVLPHQTPIPRIRTRIFHTSNSLHAPNEFGVSRPSSFFRMPKSSRDTFISKNEPTKA